LRSRLFGRPGHARLGADFTFFCSSTVIVSRSGSSSCCHAIDDPTPETLGIQIRDRISLWVLAQAIYA